MHAMPVNLGYYTCLLLFSCTKCIIYYSITLTCILFLDDQWIIVLLFTGNSAVRGTCTNIQCKIHGAFLNILQNCVKKTIVGITNCPSIRSCPNCKEAIEHIDACNNMTCFSCKRHFCFVCLTKADDNGNLRCPAPHVVAPIQGLWQWYHSDCRIYTT